MHVYFKMQITVQADECHYYIQVPSGKQPIKPWIGGEAHQASSVCNSIKSAHMHRANVNTIWWLPYGMQACFVVQYSTITQHNTTVAATKRASKYWGMAHKLEAACQAEAWSRKAKG